VIVLKPERSFEDMLSSETKAWDNSGTKSPVSLESLRSRARALSPGQREKIETEVAELFPLKVSSPKVTKNRGWRGLAAGLAAAMVLLTFAPAMARSAMDLPGIGVLIQQFAMRHTGLGWAFENGYIQGTMIQTSKNGVTVKVLGYLADPVHTTVIYVIQGVDSRQIEDNAIPVTINSVQGEGVFSWGGEVTATAVGFVGTVHTWAIPDPEATLNIAIGLPGNDSMNIILPVSREEISRLAEVKEIGSQRTMSGITVAVDSVTVTPSQLMVEYRLEGQKHEAGGLWGQEVMHLRGPSLYMEPRAGSGGTFDAQTLTWHLKAIFDRPADLSGLEFIIPVQAQHVDVSFEWPLEATTAVAHSGDMSFEIYDAVVTANSVFFRYLFREDIQNLRSFELLYQDGSSEHIAHPVLSWSYLQWLGVSLPVREAAVPVAVRAYAVSVPVKGPWVIPLALD
jgi:hypothetical protein